jgi:hypothetical protein
VQSRDKLYFRDNGRRILKASVPQVSEQQLELTRRRFNSRQTCGRLESVVGCGGICDKRGYITFTLPY